MTKYVIGPDVAMRLALDRAVIRADHQLLAPTLLRSQMLSCLYQTVRRGEMTKKDADEQLNYVRGLRIRLLGDRFLQNVAWKVAVQLEWSDTYDAEYVALTQLQSDAFVTLDQDLSVCRGGPGDRRTDRSSLLISRAHLRLARVIEAHTRAPNYRSRGSANTRNAPEREHRSSAPERRAAAPWG